VILNPRSNFTFARLERPREDGEERRFAGAVRADQRDGVTGADLEGGRSKGDDAPVAPGDAAGTEERGQRPPPLASSFSERPFWTASTPRL
jgi:hypothetical protein